MTAVDGLASFLRARLDEREQAARAATPGPWWHNPRKQWLGPVDFERYDLTQGEEFVGYGGPSPFVGCVAATGPADHPQSMADASFIASNEPAYVLADIEAKRLQLAAIQVYLTPVPTPVGYPSAARAMKLEVESAEEKVAEVMLRLLALPFATHSDYRPEWAPSVSSS